MRARLAIVIAIGTLGLVVATEALAFAPPTQVSPANGASFTAPADQIPFKASVPLGDAPSIDFFISRGPDTDQDTGLLSPRIDDIQAQASVPPSNPAIYAASPSGDVSWPDRPGTYYWQAAYYVCPTPYSQDCTYKVSTTRSFKINPRPASTVGPGSEPKTFLDFHPRHRTHKRKVKFAFSSDVAGANFQCLYAQGWKACKSPHIFRHLKPGRFQFQARAVLNGVEDPSPASWTFKVLR
jgi:hypothetical protein